MECASYLNWIVSISATLVVHLLLLFGLAVGEHFSPNNKTYCHDFVEAMNCSFGEMCGKVMWQSTVGMEINRIFGYRVVVALLA